MHSLRAGYVRRNRTKRESRPGGQVARRSCKFGNKVFKSKKLHAKGAAAARLHNLSFA